MKKVQAGRFTSTILTLVFTLIVCLMVVYNSQQGGRIVKYYSPLIDAAMEIKLEAAIAHLWFEEIVSGDSSISIDEVMMHINESIWYTNAMLQGDENREGKFLPIEEPILRQKIQETQASLKLFRNVAEERWLNKINSGIGSDIDQKFDRIFYEFINHADGVETELQHVMKMDLKRLTIMQYIVLFFILIMGVFTSIIYYLNEKKQILFTEQLNDGTANLRSLLDNREDSIWSLDRNYKYIIFNKPYTKAIFDEYGINIEKGMNALEILPVEIIKFWKPKFESAFQGENVAFEFTQNINRIDQHFQVTLNPIIIEGVVTGASVFSENITDKKNSHIKIIESEKQFRSLIEQSGDAMYLSDFDGNIINVNQKACEILGYERKELIKLNVADIDINFTVTTDQREFWDNIVPGETQTLETQHKRKNGELITVEVNIGLYEYSNKQLILGFARDITERKQAEELLRKSENSVRAKLDAILLPEGNLEVLSLEEILDIPAISKIMEAIFKLTGVAVALGDLDGKALVSFGWQEVCIQYHRAHPESCKNCTESDTVLASVVEAGTYKLYKCKNNMWDLSTPIHVGGRHVGNIFIGQFFFKDEIPELVTFKNQAKLYGFNEADYLLALEKAPRVGRDTVNALAVFYAQFSTMISNLSFSSIKFAKIVNKQKQAEYKIKQLNEELESKVNIRTAELEKKSKDLRDSQSALLNIVEDLNEKSEQLEENTAALESVNKELESFSYSVSHDLRAPLRGIDGFSQALLEDYGDLLDEQGKNYLSRVRNGTQKMALLIDEMLNLSRLGRRALKPGTVNLSEIVQSICSEITALEPQRPVEIIITEDLSCFADPTLMRAVLQNLLENAWKFTSKKEKTIIEFSQIVKDGKITYFVRDNGAGFNMDYSNKLYTPFQRLHRTSEFPGTGIGLTTVQRIIHRHNGELWAESEVDKGAIFYFTLKL